MEMQLKKSKNTPKIPPKHKTTNPKHNEDYVFVEKPGEDFTGLKLISGPFASIVYHYGNVGFRPESEAVDGALPMVFDYTVIENQIASLYVYLLIKKFFFNEHIIHIYEFILESILIKYTLSAKYNHI